MRASFSLSCYFISAFSGLISWVTILYPAVAGVALVVDRYELLIPLPASDGSPLSIMIITLSSQDYREAVQAAICQAGRGFAMSL